MSDVRPGGDDPISAAHQALARGGMVVVVDHVRRIGVAGFAGRALTPSRVNFLISECRGILYAGVAAARLDFLGIPSQTADYGIAGKIRASVDWASSTSTTGISAIERANTIRALLGTEEPSTFRSPGHVVPVALAARPAFVDFYLTEALQYLADGTSGESGVVLCAVLRDDGRQAGPNDLAEFAASHDAVAVDIADVIRDRRRRHGWDEVWPGRAAVRLRHFARILHVRGVGLHERRATLPISVHALCPYGLLLDGDCDCRAELDRAHRQLSALEAGAVVLVGPYGIGPSQAGDVTTCAARSGWTPGVAGLMAAELAAATATPLIDVAADRVVS